MKKENPYLSCTNNFAININNFCFFEWKNTYQNKRNKCKCKIKNCGSASWRSLREDKKVLWKSQVVSNEFGICGSGRIFLLNERILIRIKEINVTNPIAFISDVTLGDELTIFVGDWGSFWVLLVTNIIKRRIY